MQPAAIRALTPQDLPHLPGLLEATGLLPPEGVAMMTEMASAHLQAAGDEGGEEGLWLICPAAAEAGSPPIGLAYAAPERLTDGTWNLLMIGLVAESRGQGLGLQMMRAAEDVLRAQGVRLLLVETSGTEGFEPVRRFYRGLGYTEEARIRNYYAAGDDKVIFSLDL